MQILKEAKTCKKVGEEVSEKQKRRKGNKVFVFPCNNYLLQHHTQNIDSVETAFAQTAEEYCLFHGHVDQTRHLVCNPGASLPIKMLCRLDEPLYPSREDAVLDQENRGERSRAIGRLRRDVVLYPEEHLNSQTVGKKVQCELRS